MRSSSLAALVAVLSLSACSGLGPAAPAPGPETPDAPAATHPAYETFDPAGLDAEPPVAGPIVHDVPAGVMAGRVRVPDQAGAPAPQEPVAQQVEGFRVQVFSSANRDAAERVRGEAARWLQSTTSPSMDVMVAYLQPYYRVRLGSFATREEAEAALALVRRQYGEAFLVPDLVTVMR